MRMLGVSEEYLHLIGLVIEEYKNLQKLDPEHPLLESIILKGQKGFIKTDNFSERYNSEDLGRFYHVMGLHANYYLDLSCAQGKDGEEVLEKLFGIRRNHKEKRSSQ